MPVINYVCVSAGPLILHTECSPYIFLSMFLEKRFLHALVLCQEFWSLWTRVKNVQSDLKLLFLYDNRL